MVAAQASPACPEEQATPQELTNLELCRRLEPIVRHPGDHPLNDYEQALNQYLGALCYRDEAAGWKVDKGIRDTGPWVGTYANGKWTGQYYGTHAPVMIWYSPDFFAWLKANRPEASAAPAAAQPVPDGAIMVKEMYTAPAAACAGIEPRHLLPVKNGAAVMIRAGKVSHDGWFWGWYGYGAKSGWSVDWPAPPAAPYPNMGFGQYCVNCHASAADNQTFAALTQHQRRARQAAGLPQPELLSQSAVAGSAIARRAANLDGRAWAAQTGRPRHPHSAQGAARTRGQTRRRQTRAGRQRRARRDRQACRTQRRRRLRHAARHLRQCLGQAGRAAGQPVRHLGPMPGLPQRRRHRLAVRHDRAGQRRPCCVNVSPYGTWRGSPMGLAGRDPVFFAQLASETEKFHPGAAAVIQDTCFGCHGVLGERQFAIDSAGDCNSFTRAMVDAVPYPANDAKAKWAHYGALARDGISCAACHHMVLGEKDSDAFKNGPQNKCVAERQAFLNPGLTEFARRPSPAASSSARPTGSTDHSPSPRSNR